ncbi:MAG: hypothetical protein M3N51_09100 [Actinomycetota bacterium]|nr:hypothetical protein [Actinomycetota bacterium]
MDTPVLIAIVVVVALVAALLGWGMGRRRRSSGLKDRFGPEYDRVVEESRDRGSAETELEARAERRAQLDIRPLDPDAQRRYQESWRVVQQRFVDEPGEAVQDADRLVMRVMRERGYPMDDFEQRSADISVDHPVVVENYRTAHAIAMDQEQGRASTEDLRQALVSYRALFEELLESDEGRPGIREATR